MYFLKNNVEQQIKYTESRSENSPNITLSKSNKQRPSKFEELLLMIKTVFLKFVIIMWVVFRANETLLITWDGLLRALMNSKRSHKVLNELVVVLLSSCLKDMKMNKLKGIFTLTANHMLDAARSQLAWCPCTVICLFLSTNHATGKECLQMKGCLWKDRAIEKEGHKLS